MLVFDLRRPDNAQFTITQAQTCGLSLFPR
jgi:hypothetical protein